MTQKLVIFDLDRTIVRFGSYTPFLLWYAWRYAPYRLLLAPIVLLAMISYKLRLFSRKQLKQVMFSLLVGSLTLRKAEQVGDAFADRIIGTGCYGDALRVIAGHKAKSDYLVLATASFTFYAAAIGRKLGFDHVIATELQETGGRLVPQIVGDNCYGLVKRQRIEDFIAGGTAPTLPTLFYTDDHSDIPTLDLADAGVAVNPKPKLRQYAAGKPSIEIATWQ